VRQNLGRLASVVPDGDGESPSGDLAANSGVDEILYDLVLDPSVAQADVDPPSELPALLLVLPPVSFFPSLHGIGAAHVGSLRRGI